MENETLESGNNNLQNNHVVQNDDEVPKKPNHQENGCGCINKLVYQYGGDNFNYDINVIGKFITHLDLSKYNQSDFMPHVKDQCVNLIELKLQFFVINKNDFIQTFKNMKWLTKLKLTMLNKNSKIPKTLVASIMDIKEQLTVLHLRCINADHVYLHDDFVEIFAKGLKLVNLKVVNYYITKTMANAILERKLHKIDIDFSLPAIKLNDIAKLDTLETIRLTGSNMTYQGLELLSALPNLVTLKFDKDKSNKFITTRSCQCLSMMKGLKHLNLNKCTNVNNQMVLALAINLTDLEVLKVVDTKVDSNIISLLKKRRNHPNCYPTLDIYVGFIVHENTQVHVKTKKKVRLQGNKITFTTAK